MTDKLELKSCYGVIGTVDVANIESIFHGKPIEPDILTVVMKDGKRLYCDEICPIDSLQEEPITEDLEEAARKIGQKYFPNENNIWARPNYEAKKAECAFMEGAKWQKGNLWKNAQGDDLPEIDREVIVLYEPYQLEGSGECAVGFAHRPPERWYGINLDGEEHVFEPKTYDKGQWNQPDVKWWLDLDLPIKGK